MPQSSLFIMLSTGRLGTTLHALDGVDRALPYALDEVHHALPYDLDEVHHALPYALALFGVVGCRVAPR